MNRLARAWRRAWQTVKATTLRFSGRVSTWSRQSLGRTRYNYAQWVGDGRGNAIVVACVLWLCRTFPEAPVRIQSREGDELTPLPDHPLTELLATPNPYYPGELLWWATLGDWLLSGNAYWLKVRSRAGRVVQLWWVPAATMTPIRPLDGSGFLSHYEYQPGGQSAPEPWDPRDVIHFRYGLNPADGGLTGLSPLAALLREVFTDDEAANFSASLLRNLGVPGVVLAPKGDAGDVDAESVKAEFRQRFGQDNAGEPMVMTGPTEVSVLSFNPQQMELTKLRRIPEERVAAVFGIPAVVVGLGAGLDRATYSNYTEAREAAYEQNVIPAQRLLAAQLRTQLLPDFGDVRRLVIDFDLSGVRVLQEDQDALATRTANLLTSGAIMLDEALTALGKAPLPSGKGQIYYIPNNVTVTPAADLGKPPEPPPAPIMALPSGDDLLPDEAGEDDDEAAPMNGRPATRGKARGKVFTADDWAARRTADLAVIAGQLEGALALRFALTGHAVVAATKAVALTGAGNGHARRFKALDDDPGLLVPEAHQAELAETVVTGHRAALNAATATARLGLGLDFQLPFDLEDATLARLAGRIGGLADTTRDDVRRVVRQAAADGATIDEVAARLRSLFVETYRHRARTIARTETALAYNLGAVAGYRASGVVTNVRVHDGTDDDDACRAANGATWSLERADSEPTQHPNCTRAFSPIVGGS